MQPYLEFERDWVRVGPSRVHGLGLFADRDFEIDDVVGVYTGECMKCAEGNKSLFIVWCEWWNRQKSELEEWYLDSKDEDNAATRWINDCVGTKWAGMYNVKYCIRVRDNKHPVYGRYYVEVKAIADIKKGEELFADYGKAYWERYCRYFKHKDPSIFLGKEWDQAMKKNSLERRRRPKVIHV